MAVSPEIYDLLINIFKEDIQNFTISVKHNDKGVGYLGAISFLFLKEKKGKQEYNLVVKYGFVDEIIRRKSPLLTDIYVNEINFYSKVWKNFREFQLSVPLAKLFDKIPDCLANSSTEFSEIIILENLQAKKFEMYGKTTFFNEDHIKFVFETYGRFHAISFAYRALHPEEYSQVTKDIKNLWYSFSENYAEFVKVTHQMAIKGLRPEDRKVVDKYKNYLENSVEIYRDSVNYVGDYSAVLHGDCWSDNLLFKYDASGKLEDIRMIDFQFSRVGTPVYDLSYCLYVGAEKEIYEDLDRYLRIYHNSFSETVVDFGCNADLLYPFAALKDDWKKYCKFGFIMALLMWKGRLTYEDNTIDLTDIRNDDYNVIEEFVDAKYDEETYRKITRDLIIHMYENDFL